MWGGGWEEGVNVQMRKMKVPCIVNALALSSHAVPPLVCGCTELPLSNC